MFFTRSLPARLKAYPPARPPWGDGDAEAALARLLAMKDERLARLSGLLAHAGIDLAGGLAAASPRGLCEALDAWVAREWVALARSLPRGFETRWRAASWDEKERVPFSIALDTGLAVGELLRRHRPGHDWEVDRFDDHVADGQPEAGEVVVLDPTLPQDADDPLVFDALGTSLSRLLDIGLRLGSPWTFCDAIARQLHAGPGWPDITAL